MSARPHTDALAGPVSNPSNPTTEAETASIDPGVTEQNQIAFDEAPIGMAIVNREGRFLRVNAAMSEITGYSAAQLGSFEPFRFIHPDDLPVVRERASSLGVESDRVSSTHRILRADGLSRWVEARTSLVHKPDGTAAYVLVQLLDINDRKLAEDALFRAREHAETITSAMAEGYCLFIDGRIARVNRALCELTGYSEEELVGSSIPLPFWPPDEVEAIMNQRREILAAGGDTFDVPLMTKQGRRFDAEITLRQARNSDGSMLGYVTTVRDISARTRYEAAQARRTAEEQALREITKLVAAGAEQATVLDQVVAALRELFAAEAASIIRFHDSEGVGEVVSVASAEALLSSGMTLALDGDSLEANVYASGRLSERQQPEPPLPGPIDRQRSSQPTAVHIAVPITVSGRPWGCLSVRYVEAPITDDAPARLEQFASIVALGIANAQAWEALAHQAATDALTGLANRRTFQDRLVSEMDLAELEDRSLSMVLIDIDHFKTINDTFGHGIGDLVLVELARRITVVARTGELVARLGGEEFACLLPDADSEQALLAAERIRSAVEAAPFDAVGKVSVSAGVCTNEHCRQSNDLVRFADRALYRAKKTGRNTTVLYTPDVDGWAETAPRNLGLLTPSPGIG